MQEHANPDERRSTDSLAPSREGRSRILVVDDEPDSCEALRELLEAEGYDATAETSAYAAMDKIAAQDFELVLTDVNMIEMNGLELCRRIVDVRPGMPVILITGLGNMDTVIGALRIGARDFLRKPVDASALLVAVARALQSRAPLDPKAAPPGETRDPASELTYAGLLGQSTAMRQLHKLIADISGSVASVIIQGETGTGKEVIAHAIHANSPSSNGPFVALNCAAVPPGLLESELFGHARGAFTDAKTARKGLLVQANGGTLLLDEIGELPLAMQPKLLRALQERKVRPVGEHEEVPFDCRIIAATNQDLDREVAEKRFRADLYYRLDVVRITVPPLRERGDDILLLARHFLDRFAKGSRRNATLSAPATEKLMTYGWPGNVRELENCLERAVALARSDELTIEDLPEKVRGPHATPHVAPPTNDAEPGALSLFELERRHVLKAIESFGGNKSRAANQLGIDRRTLYRRLGRYQGGGSN